MRRFAVALVAGVSLLAVALSAAPVGAAPDPAPSTGAGSKHPGLTSIPNQGRLAFECPAAATACYYSGINGTGIRYVQWDCGFEGLGGHPINENIHSLKNQRGASASLYNWNGRGYELKGWVAGIGVGDFHTNVGADVVNVFC